MKMDDTMKWFRDGSLSVCGLRKETKEVLLNKDSLHAGVTQKSRIRKWEGNILEPINKIYKYK